MLLFVGCLTSQQQASVSQGRICLDNFTCCHTETEIADQIFHLTPSQYIDTGPTSPSAYRVTPGAWQGRNWSGNFKVTGMTRPGKISLQAGFEPRIFRPRGGRLNHLATEGVCACGRQLFCSHACGKRLLCSYACVKRLFCSYARKSRQQLDKR